MQLNKEKQQLNNQLEAKKKETYCLRAVQKLVRLFEWILFFKFIFKIRAYEDILEMNLNSSKNASASMDDEHKFKVVCLDNSLQSRKKRIDFFLFL